MYLLRPASHGSSLLLGGLHPASHGSLLLLGGGNALPGGDLFWGRRNRVSFRVWIVGQTRKPTHLWPFGCFSWWGLLHWHPPQNQPGVGWVVGVLDQGRSPGEAGRCCILWEKMETFVNYALSKTDTFQNSNVSKIADRQAHKLADLLFFILLCDVVVWSSRVFILIYQKTLKVKNVYKRILSFFSFTIDCINVYDT